MWGQHMKESLKQLHPIQYLVVAVAVAVIVLLKLNVSFFEQGLTGTLLIALVACVALLADYIAGIIAIGLGLLAQNYLHEPSGFSFGGMVLFQGLEFLVASLIICAFAWRQRALLHDKNTLLNNANKLQVIVKSLQKDVKGKRTEATRLRKLNKELDALVKQFLEDETYWDNKWPRGLSK